MDLYLLVEQRNKRSDYGEWISQEDWAQLDSDAEASHAHCAVCFVPRMCHYRDIAAPVTCPIVHCTAGCDARMHECKMQEHVRHVCPCATVACLNESNGCETKVIRNKMWKHLLQCPANSVVCNALWNRFSVSAENKHSLEKFSRISQDTIPCNKSSVNIHSQPLDIALALRDQEVLVKSLKIPEEVISNLKDIEFFPNHPLLPVGRDFVELLSLNDKKENDEAKSCNSFDHITSGINVSSKVVFNSSDVISRVVCKFSDINTESTNHDKCSSHENMRMDTLNGCNSSDVIEDVFKSCESENILSAKINYLEERHFSVPPPVQPTFCAKAGLHLSREMEGYGQWTKKPKSMYSFLCLESVHRSEFSAHYRNVHLDTLCGLDHWLIHRCPLFAYGCPYFQWKRTPKIGAGAGHKQYPGMDVSHGSLVGQKGTSELLAADESIPDISKLHSGRVIFCADLKAISIGAIFDQSTDIRLRGLEKLPFELLCRIAGFLDSLSLLSLSLTSRLFRQVVTTRVAKQGLLEAMWTRNDSSEKCSWRPKYVWRLSKCFPEIEVWHIANNGPMTNHLAKCQFFDPSVKVERFRMPAVHR